MEGNEQLEKKNKVITNAIPSSVKSLKSGSGWIKSLESRFQGTKPLESGFRAIKSLEAIFQKMKRPQLCVNLMAWDMDPKQLNPWNLDSM